MKLKEQGRSMIEMLGVLAIAGILSIGALVGYSYMVAKNAANDLLDELNKRVVVVSTQMLQGNRILNVEEFGDTTRHGYPTQTYILPYDTRFFAIAVDQVPVRVCKIFMRENWPLPSQVLIDNVVYDGDESLCNGEDTAPEMVFIFYEGLDTSLTPPRTCHGSFDCSYCESCIESLCRNPDNLIYYMGQCLKGIPCQDGASWDNEQNMCVCPTGVYVGDSCVTDAGCPIDARWNASLQRCVCNDQSKTYDEIQRKCIDNPCSSGQEVGYFWNGSQQYEKCCPTGQKPAYINENGQTSSAGFCCPRGYDAVTPPKSWGGYEFKQTMCVRALCEKGNLTSYYKGGLYLPICCEEEGVMAAQVSSGGNLSENGLCCAPDETVYEGDNYSYCVKKECPVSLSNRLTVDYKKCGGAGRPFTDEIPICCPAGVTAAARCNESGQCSSYGYCCQPGSTRVFSDCSSRCMLQSCPVGQELVYFKSNYANQAKCCDEDAPGAAYFDSHGKSHASGVCCEPGETAVQSEYGRCSAGPNSCGANEDLADYYQGAWLKMCCPKGVKGASSWAYNAAPICCQVGEKSVRGSSGSVCVPDSCGADETLFKFAGPNFEEPNLLEKCCPAGSSGAAYCNSSGTCASSGFCCGADETVVGAGGNSVCVPTVCSGSAPKRLNYTVGGHTFVKCCPVTSKAAAYLNVLSATNYAGFCCGENEIAIASKCEVCPSGFSPNESGDKCI